MRLYLKYKFLRIINYGIFSVENFNEKKNIQIYNTFLLLVFLNIFLYGVLLAFYKFYYQLGFIFLSFTLIYLALKLNKKNKILLSKIVIIQSFILFIIFVLCIFSFDTVFILYFFLVILYSTLIFNEKETRQKLFFIIQCFILFFIVLTPYKNYLPNLQLLPKEKIADMNLISIIDFIVFLFTYIYFHTIYQHYRENKYNLLNLRLYENNLKIKHDNINKRKLVSISSSLLNSYFTSYSNLFCQYRQEINNRTKEFKKINDYYNRLNELNNKIEEVINYQFSKDKSSFLLTYKKHEINNLTSKIIQKKFNHVHLSNTNTFMLNIHEDLYYFFVLDIVEGFTKKYLPSNIYIENKQQEYPIKIVSSNSKIIFVMGIQVHYKFDINNDLIISLYFFKHPDQTAIYHA